MTLDRTAEVLDLDDLDTPIELRQSMEINSRNSDVITTGPVTSYSSLGSPSVSGYAKKRPEQPLDGSCYITGIGLRSSVLRTVLKDEATKRSSPSQLHPLPTVTEVDENKGIAGTVGNKSRAISSSNTEKRGNPGQRRNRHDESEPSGTLAGGHSSPFDDMERAPNRSFSSSSLRFKTNRGTATDKDRDVIDMSADHIEKDEPGRHLFTGQPKRRHSHRHLVVRESQNRTLSSDEQKFHINSAYHSTKQDNSLFDTLMTRLSNFAGGPPIVAKTNNTKDREETLISLKTSQSASTENTREHDEELIARARKEVLTTQALLLESKALKRKQLIRRVITNLAAFCLIGLLVILLYAFRNKIKHK